MDLQKIKDYLMAMGDFTAEEIEKYGFILESSVTSVLDLLKDSADVNDARIMLLMAAKAYYKICCLPSFSDGVTSFSAGDVSITEKEGIALNGAKEIYNTALSDCREFINDNSFAFLGI